MIFQSKVIAKRPSQRPKVCEQRNWNWRKLFPFFFDIYLTGPAPFISINPSFCANTSKRYYPGFNWKRWLISLDRENFNLKGGSLCRRICLWLAYERREICSNLRSSFVTPFGHGRKRKGCNGCKEHAHDSCLRLFAERSFVNEAFPLFTVNNRKVDGIKGNIDNWFKRRQATGEDWRII